MSLNQNIERRGIDRFLKTIITEHPSNVFEIYSLLLTWRKKTAAGRRSCEKSARGLGTFTGRRQGVVMGRSVGGIDLNSCFSQLFIRQEPTTGTTTIFSTTTTTTSGGAGKAAATYFNSSFPCEFLAWTYDRLPLSPPCLSNSGY